MGISQLPNNIFSVLNHSLQEVAPPTLLINFITFLCSLKMVLLSSFPPPKKDAISQM
jgi:hypothetical protein